MAEEIPRGRRTPLWWTLLAPSRPLTYHAVHRRSSCGPALAGAGGASELVARVVVRPMLAIVGGRLLITRWAPGVTVVMTRQLVHAVRSIPAVLDASEVGAVYEVARRSTTWNPAPHSRR